jgi:puromycin-sensitive aminopeptidase
VSDTSHRLPADVRPQRYDLVLEPDLERAEFTGQVTIDVTVDAPTDRIVLHALDLEITVATVTAGAGTDAGEDQLGRDASVTLDAEAETATLLLDAELPVGPAQVALSFRGVLNDQLVGFYRSTFREDGADGATDGGTEHTLAVTQFESTHARRAFPCFDEPALKAVFSLTMVVPADLLVVANTAEASRAPLADGRVRVRFADTIPMSTYLVAVVVGPLEATEVRMVAGVEGPIPLRVVHPPGSAHLCDFALDVAEAALQYFEQYYGLPYPGDKVDLVAVPDFAFGAMENLGCITFREVLLLIDPSTATQPELQRVADVINHELAHMWFGDLVTMSWWNGIWLNEAFATFMEIKASESFRPEWDVWTTFGLARAAAFDTDTLRSTRPIEYEVVTAADAEGMFDILTYEKGASVVRMLEQYLGEEAFRAGISEYLRRHAFGTTETTDLWDALEEVTGEPVRRIMDHWIFQGGHPVVQVERLDDGFGVGQTRAVFDDEPGEGRWPVPMVLAVETPEGGVERTRLLLEDAMVLPARGRPRFVQPNVGGAGFYRVELDAELRRALLEHGAPGALERFVLLDDTWVGVVAGRVPLADGAELVELMARDESDPSVWRRLAGVGRELARLAGTEHGDRSARWIRAVAAPALDRVEQRMASSHDDHEHLLETRGVLFHLVGAEGRDEDVRARARDLLDDAKADASLRAAATSVVAASATAEEHSQLERRWRSASTPQDELRYLNALVDAADPVLFAHALELAATEVRTQNAPYLLRRAIDHPTLGAEAWALVATRWDELAERFPSNSLPRMLEGIRGVTDRDLAGSIESFLHGHPTPSGERQVHQHLERMWVTVEAARRVRDELADSPGMLVYAPD